MFRYTSRIAITAVLLILTVCSAWSTGYAATYEEQLAELRALEKSPLIEFTGQIRNVGEQAWRRDRGEYTFRLAKSTIDRVGKDEAEYNRLVSLLQNATVEVSLDFRDTGKLALATARGIVLAPTSTPGFYHASLPVQTIWDLEDQGIRNALYPAIPVDPIPESQLPPVNDDRGRHTSLDDVTLLSDNFNTGEFPGPNNRWTATDLNSDDGLDYWGISPSNQCNMTNQIWCAAHRDPVPDPLECVAYDNNMDAVFYNTTALNYEDATSITLNYRLYIASSDGCTDFNVEVATSPSGTWWTFETPTLNTNGRWGNHNPDITGYPYFRFRFQSYGCGNARYYQGEIVDDVSVVAHYPTPSAAVLVAPADNVHLCPNFWQTFVWGTSTNACHYRFEISTYSDFRTGSDIVDYTGGMTVHQYPVYLTGTGQRWWRVTPFCGDASGTPGVRSFTLDAPMTSPPSLTSPTTGTNICANTNQQFCWSTVTNANQYFIRFDEHADMLTPTYESPYISQTCYTQSLPAGTWYWQVHAVNACGKGQPSSIWSVTAVSPLGAPTLIGPDNYIGACAGLPLTYSWNAVTGATNGYQVQWCDWPSFGNGYTVITQDVAAGQTSVNTKSPNRTDLPYWRVVAKNACGNGTGSSVRHIYWEAQPGKVTQVSPANNASLVVGASTTYQWSATSNESAGYLLTWSEGSNFLPGLDHVDLEVASGQTSVTTTLPNRSDLPYWRVMAKNDYCMSGSFSYRTIQWQSRMLKPGDGDQTLDDLASEPADLNTPPDKFSLEQNYPNPFNQSTMIRYALPVSENVSLRIYNVSGQEMATLVNNYMPAGTYNVNWSGQSLSGASVPSGVYFCRIVAGDYSHMIKMLLVK